MTRRSLTAVLAAACLSASLVAAAPSTAAPAASGSASGSASSAAAKAGPSKAAVLKRNKLYKVKALSSAGCAPASQIPLDTSANLEAYYQSVLPCLNAAWKNDWKKLRKAGLRFKAPKVKVHDGATKTPCGTPGALSFYCPRNSTIYMYDAEITPYWTTYPTDYSHALTRLVGTHTLAHEYGHHVQHLVGILDAIGARYQGKLERRAELQASCLANVFLSSQRDAYPLLYDFASRPDLWRSIEVPNHGSAANQAYWTERGYSSATPKECNTFKAPGSQVS